MAINQYADLACVNLVVRIWSGQKKLKPEELNLKPEDVNQYLTMGAKRVTNPDSLKGFLALRREAERLLQNKGIKFMGGYAVSQKLIGSIVLSLQGIKAQFDAKKAQFEKDYGKDVADWIAAMPPDMATVIAPAVPKITDIMDSFEFDFQVYNVTNIEGISKGLDKETEKLSDKLMHDITQGAVDIYNSSFRDKMKVSQKSLRPLRTLIQKAESLEFLNESVPEAIQAAKQAMAKLPKKGYLEGQDRMVAVGILDTLSSIGKTSQISEVVDEEEDEQPAVHDEKEQLWF